MTPAEAVAEALAKRGRKWGKKWPASKYCPTCGRRLCAGHDKRMPNLDELERRPMNWRRYG